MVHPKIINTSKRLIINYPYYSEILLSTYITEDPQLPIPTMCVNVTKRGFNLYYDKGFVDKNSQKICNFAILHELFHLIFDHPTRGSTITNSKLKAIAIDMVVNEVIRLKIDKNIYEFLTYEVTNKEGKKEKIPSIFLPPKQYLKEGNPLVFEDIYLWLEKNKEKDPEVKRMLKNTSQFDVHMLDEVPSAIRKMMVQDILNSIRARGLETSDFEETVGMLRKSKKDYLKQILKGISSTIGRIKYRTWRRENRKGLLLKGFQKKGAFLNVILDTSGSMHGYFMLILTTIFRNDISYNLIQNDTTVKKVEKINSKSQLNRIKISGLGGTILQPAINLVKEKYNKWNTIVLTDGYTDTLDFSGIKGKVLILTNDKKCSISNGLKQVRQIVIDENY